jgi:hypothetical protein
MKLKFLDLTVIHGAATASSDTNAPLPQPRSLQGQAQSPSQSPSQAPAPSPSPIDELAPWPASMAGPEGLMALFRSSDSVSLLGETGVITVGVNDLGWVVYDWAPGP